MREFLISHFFEKIRGLTYVVQRNWENLPGDYEVDGHGDLDLFATDEDKIKIQEILKEYPEIPCDVRSPEDDYYPREIAEMLLISRTEQKGFFVPGPIPAFIALYYHDLIHKEGNPYGAKLKKTFKEAFPPVRCKDAGVGFYDNN